jgi:hypothetical protein
MLHAIREGGCHATRGRLGLSQVGQGRSGAGGLHFARVIAPSLHAVPVDRRSAGLFRSAMHAQLEGGLERLQPKRRTVYQESKES